MKIDYKKIMNLKRDIRLETVSRDKKEYKLTIYGAIGGWFSENDADTIRRKLNGVDADVIHVHINSGGGSAFDGVAICNMLKQHKAEVIVHIDGWAASAASIIAMGGDKIIMPSNTMMMIHQASTIEYGNADDFEKTAKDLRKIDTALRQSYKNRFVGTEEELIQLMKDETWLTADEALALGFADEVVNEIEIDETQEEEETDITNIKEDLVAKYAAEAQEKNKQKQEPIESNMKRFFLNL